MERTEKNPSERRTIELYFPFEPMAIQSVRFFKRGNRISTYQPQRNLSYKDSVRILALEQLPADFELFGHGISIACDFVFLPPKSMRKADLKRIADGEIVYKTTKPDLQDNLHKGLCDALQGIVWQNDSMICDIRSRKRYGLKPSITIKVADVF